MGKIILVTGGARSGKSKFAEDLTASLSDKVCYIATSEPFDEEMKDRIKKHIKQRPSHWKTIEAYEGLSNVVDEISRNYKVGMLDCITVMVNNLMYHSKIDFENAKHEVIDGFEKKIVNEISELIISIKKNSIDFIIVTNEIGLGIVPENRYVRIYRDIIGRVNQYIAKNSDEVYLIVSGISVPIK